MTGRRLFSAGLSVGLAASLCLAGCKRAQAPPPPELPAAPPSKNELPVEQTPVKSLYEEKPGVLYEQPARTPTVTRGPASAPTPSPAAKK
jgi:hypothetical protein